VPRPHGAQLVPIYTPTPSYDVAMEPPPRSPGGPASRLVCSTAPAPCALSKGTRHTGAQGRCVLIRCLRELEPPAGVAVCPLSAF
jgi:hypothetical protein